MSGANDHRFALAAGDCASWQISQEAEKIANGTTGTGGKARAMKTVAGLRSPTSR
jgi:hypothetical protein